ncbi:MAG: chemotaxis protein CheB [Aureliella sp.]
MTNAPIKALFAVPRIGMRLLFIREFQRNKEINLTSLAFSYEVAREQLRDQQHFDIIVLDCVEGLEDPVELVKSVQTIRSNLPIILLCDHSVQSKAKMLDAIRIGASDYVVAPTGSNTKENAAMLKGPLSQKIRHWANRSAHKLSQSLPMEAFTTCQVHANQPSTTDNRSRENPSRQNPNISAGPGADGICHLPTIPKSNTETGLWNPTKPRNRKNESSVDGQTSFNNSVLKAASNPLSDLTTTNKAHAGDRLTTGHPPHARILTIASSTGGPAALKAVLGGLTEDFPLPIVCVQHNLIGFDKLLVKQLDSQSPLRVQLAEQDQEIKPGHVYFAPADLHMTLRKQANGHTIDLDDGPKVCQVRPAADILFQSVARNFRDRAVGLVLTGMGIDGLSGCRAIKQVGGKVMVQSGATCTVWGMPRAVQEAGLADSVLDLSIIAPTLVGMMTLDSTPDSQKVSGCSTVLSGSG